MSDYKLVKLLLEEKERGNSNLLVFAISELGIDRKTAVKLARRINGEPEFDPAPCPFVPVRWSSCIKDKCMRYSDGICRKGKEVFDNERMGIE